MLEFRKVYTNGQQRTGGRGRGDLRSALWHGRRPAPTRGTRYGAGAFLGALILAPDFVSDGAGVDRHGAALFAGHQIGLESTDQQGAASAQLGAAESWVAAIDRRLDDAGIGPPRMCDRFNP